MKDIAVIMPVYKAHDTITNTLHSIAMQKYVDFNVYTTDGSGSLFVQGSSGSVGVGTISPESQFSTFAIPGLGGTAGDANYHMSINAHGNRGDRLMISTYRQATEATGNHQQVQHRIERLIDGSGASPGAARHYLGIGRSLYGTAGEAIEFGYNRSSDLIG